MAECSHWHYFWPKRRMVDERARETHPFCSTSGWIKVSCTLFTVHCSSYSPVQPFEWHAMYYISLSLRHIERGIREHRKHIMQEKRTSNMSYYIICLEQTVSSIFPVWIVFGLYGNVERLQCSRINVDAKTLFFFFVVHYNHSFLPVLRHTNKKNQKTIDYWVFVKNQIHRFEMWRIILNLQKFIISLFIFYSFLITLCCNSISTIEKLIHWKIK